MINTEKMINTGIMIYLSGPCCNKHLLFHTKGQRIQSRQRTPSFVPFPPLRSLRETAKKSSFPYARRMASVSFPYGFRMETVWEEYGESMGRACRKYQNSMGNAWEMYSCGILAAYLRYQDSIKSVRNKYQPSMNEKYLPHCPNASKGLEEVSWHLLSIRQKTNNNDWFNDQENTSSQAYN